MSYWVALLVSPSQVTLHMAATTLSIHYSRMDRGNDQAPLGRRRSSSVVRPAFPDTKTGGARQLSGTVGSLTASMTGERQEMESASKTSSMAAAPTRRSYSLPPIILKRGVVPVVIPEA